MDSQWTQMLNFIDLITGTFPISKEGMHLGGVQFATRAYKYSDMAADKATAQAARFNMAIRGGRPDLGDKTQIGGAPITLVPGAMGVKTNTHLGVEEAMKIPGRNGVIKILLCITDGIPTGGTNKGGLTDKALVEAQAQGYKVLFLLVGTIFQWVPLPVHWMSAPVVQINSFGNLNTNTVADIRSRIVDIVCENSTLAPTPAQTSSRTRTCTCTHACACIASDTIAHII